MGKFELVGSFNPSSAQKKAVNDIVAFINANSRYQTLLGVTGSGKTYTMAQLIVKLQIPTLIMTHNKTLAAQLYSEFKSFFPKNRVEYFISYYDYYQPEAYIPRTDLYIEKDSSINSELERLRISATASLLSYDDIICIASVSANYGVGDPKEYESMVQIIEVGGYIKQKDLLLRLVEMGYKRDDNFFDRGNFRVRGDIIDIYATYSNNEVIRIEFFDDMVDNLYFFDYIENRRIKSVKKVIIYAASNFIVGSDRLKQAISNIKIELKERLNFYKQEKKELEYKRLKQRVEFDLEMLEETGSCKGIENYARHLSSKKSGETPYTLFDYFEAKNRDYLVIVDESHVSLPQFRGMYAGDRSRKEVLVEYGFRLPSALDNRPLKFDEFINKAKKYLFVSATPANLEVALSKNSITQQIIRPTGLLDPPIEILDSDYQVEKLYDEIKDVIKRKERVLVTVLTKKMAEELTKYYLELGLKVRYMHSEIDAIERNQIIIGLRKGDFDVLVGINLLREGLDIPEVSLVAIFDADKEGFLRSETSLIQTIGRASRNANSKVIMFAKKITKSMQYAIDITKERREKQNLYNIKHNITPKTVTRKIEESLKLKGEDEITTRRLSKMPKTQKREILKELTKKMYEYAKALEFESAAKYRDEIQKIKAL